MADESAGGSGEGQVAAGAPPGIYILVLVTMWSSGLPGYCMYRCIMIYMYCMYTVTCVACVTRVTCDTCDTEF